MVHMSPYNAFEPRDVNFWVDKQMEFLDYSHRATCKLQRLLI